MSAFIPGPAVTVPVVNTPLFSALYSKVTREDLLTCKNQLDQGHANLKKIHGGHAIFQGTLHYEACPELLFAYDYEIHIPLDDPVFQADLNKVWQYIFRSTYPQGVRFQFTGVKDPRRSSVGLTYKQAEDVLSRRR